MEKVKITKIFRGEAETKFGVKPKVGSKTDKHGDKWLSTFKVQGTENWKEGDTVEIATEEKNGYLNFSLNASPTAALEARIQALEEKVFGAKDEPVADPDDF